MKRLIQKSKKILDEEGMFGFLKKSLSFVFIRLARGLAWILLPLTTRKMREFDAASGRDAVNFIESYAGSFIRPIQIKSELVGLLDIFTEKAPKIVLEIGTARGGTLFCFSKLAPADATIISIDLPEGEFGGGYSKRKIPLYQSFKKKDQSMFLLREDSHMEQTVEKVRGILGGRQIDFLFIDGDHTYEGVKKDFELYSPLVGKDGIIALHDVAVHPKETECFVSVFWDEIKDNYKHKELIENRNQGWAGIGVLYF